MVSPAWLSRFISCHSSPQFLCLATRPFFSSSNKSDSGLPQSAHFLVPSSKRQICLPSPHSSSPDSASFRCCCCLVSHVQLFVTAKAVARQAPLSMGFHRREYWSRLPFPSPGDLPDPGIEPAAPAWQEDSLPLSHQGS